MRILSLIGVVIVFLLNAGLVNGQPLNPEIISVSVDTIIPNNQGRVTISWKPNQHPEVSEYGIYEDIGQGQFVEITKVSSDLVSYLHELASADKVSRGYSMASFSTNPDLTSELIAPHYTVFLQSDAFDYCEKKINLIWSNYIGWGNGLDSYSIYRKKSNEPYQLLANVTAGGDTTYTESNVAFNSIYKYYIVANNSNGTKALSNIIQIITDAEQSVDLTDFYLDSAIYNGNTEYLSFNSLGTNQISEYNVFYRESESSSYKHLKSIENDESSRYKIIDDAPGEKGRYYNVSAVGLCDDSLGITNVIRQVVLKGSMSDNIVTLDWNNGFNEIDEFFEVYLQVDGGSVGKYEQLSGQNQVQYDLTELSNGSSENFCFYISANLPLGYYSQSNMLCFTITPIVEMATAFTPNGDGLNDYIKPDIKYADIKGYEFLIYDKFGQRIFETETMSFPWDGKAGNKYVKEGAYLYYLKFTTQWGNSYEKSGVINVIYP